MANFFAKLFTNWKPQYSRCLRAAASHVCSEWQHWPEKKKGLCLFLRHLWLE